MKTSLVAIVLTFVAISWGEQTAAQPQTQPAAQQPAQPAAPAAAPQQK